jgi:hypothetical protein
LEQAVLFGNPGENYLIAQGLYSSNAYGSIAGIVRSALVGP